jgi:hypothetical protein
MTQQQQHIKPRIDIWGRPELSSAEGAAVRAPEWKEGRRRELLCRCDATERGSDTKTLYDPCPLILFRDTHTHTLTRKEMCTSGGGMPLSIYKV